jgi:hypothetical protein
MHFLTYQTPRTASHVARWRPRARVSRRPLRAGLILFLSLCACSRSRTGVANAGSVGPAAPIAGEVDAGAAEHARLGSRQWSWRGTPCGDLDCRQYASARDAFIDVLGADPLVVAVGEAHAPKGASVASAATRFTSDILPALADRASDLLVELMMPPRGCTDAAAEVREKHRAVTSLQADHDQNEYVAMGEAARSLGIVPDMLRPSCADIDAIARAGAGAIGASLELIARLALRQALRLIDRDATSETDRGKMVVLYGGLLHNDLAPRPDAAAWSYAPAVDEHVRGRFVAIDLIVPEFIGDDEPWRSLAWWSHYDRARLGAKATLFRTGERSFVIVFAAK